MERDLPRCPPIQLAAQIALGCVTIRPSGRHEATDRLRRLSPRRCHESPAQSLPCSTRRRGSARSRVNSTPTRSPSACGASSSNGPSPPAGGDHRRGRRAHAASAGADRRPPRLARGIWSGCAAGSSGATDFGRSRLGRPCKPRARTLGRHAVSFCAPIAGDYPGVCPPKIALRGKRLTG